MTKKVLLFDQSRGALAALALFSTIYSALGIVGAIFMMQVYDRVMSSHSVPTLLVLCVIAGFLFVIQGVLQSVRTRLLGRIGDRLLAEHEAMMLAESARRAAAGKKGTKAAPSPAQDLDTVARAFKGNVVSALLDGPWAVIYLALLWIVSPLLGIGAALSIAALLLVALIAAWFKVAVDDDIATADHQRAWEQASRHPSALAAASSVHLASSVAAARNTSRVDRRGNIEREADAKSSIGVLRNSATSGILAVGAFLVITGEATMGVMMAATQLISRIMTPAEAVIRERKTIQEAAAAWRRLRAFSGSPGEAETPEDLELATAEFQFRGVNLATSPNADPFLKAVNFTAKPGQVFLVTGLGNSGKSLLLHAIAGAVQQASGSVRLGGIRLATIDPNVRDRAFGILPQDAVIFPGTLADIIARFNPEIGHDEVVQASKAMGLHDRIMSHPMDYQVKVLANGPPLSFSFAKRIQLARAICGDPHVLVLDDPTSGLDSDAVKPVINVIAERRKSGKITFVSNFPPMLLAPEDQVLAVKDGKVLVAGSVGEVFKPKPVVVKEPAVGGENVKAV